MLADDRADLLSPLWRHPRRFPHLTNRQWEALLGQARVTRMLPRLATHCQDLGDAVNMPPGLQRHLAAGLRWVDRQAHEVQWELDCIVRATASLNLPVVLLKGAAYTAAGLPAARGRMFNDIDVMFERRHLDAVESALMAGGWISVEPDPYNQRYYREWRHELPPLRHVTRNSFLDVHHTITAPTSHFAVDGALLMKHIRPVDASGRLFVLQPVDMVLHSAVHLFQEGEYDHGLRDLLDLDALLIHFGEVEPDFWPALFQRADELALREPLFHAMHHVQRLFGTAPPAEWAGRVMALQPNAFARLAMGWLLGQALRPMHPSCDLRFTGVARTLLYLRAQWLRMPLKLLLPHLVRKAWMRAFPKDESDPFLTA